MFSFDFSKDKPNISEPIPAGTKVLVRMSYTPGGADLPGTPPDQRRGQLTAAKAPSDAVYLKAEFTVLRGPYKGRKWWDNMTVAGGKVNEKGDSIAAAITRGNMRSIIDAARGLSSKDESPAACAQRVLTNGFGDFQGMVFAVKTAVEPAKDGYAAKNKMGVILTVDHKDYPKSEAELDALPQQHPTPGLPAVAAPSWAGNGVAGGAAPQPATGGFVAPTATSNAAPTAPTAVVVAAASAPDNGLPAWIRP